MSRREGDDDYENIVAQLGSDWRVIVCRDNWQWIVQERKWGEWKSRHYLTSRDGVLRRCEGKPGWEVLASLPEHFPPAYRRGKPPHGAKSPPAAS